MGRGGNETVKRPYKTEEKKFANCIYIPALEYIENSAAHGSAGVNQALRRKSQTEFKTTLRWIGMWRPT